MDLVELNKRRAAESDQAQSWTPIDALKDTLRKVESGEWPATCIYIAVAWDEEGHSENRACVAARSNREACGLLAQHFALMSTDAGDD